MVLERLYTAHGILFSNRFSDKQPIMPFSCKIELRLINPIPLLSKWIGMIYFASCLSFYLIFYII